MKRSISILLCLVLIFSSFSFVFADEWGSSQITSVVNNVSSINTTLSNIYTRVNTITNYLYDSNHSIAYWTSAIASWMQPIYTALTSGLQVNLGLDAIISGLNRVENVAGGGTTYYPYLLYNSKSNANWLSDIYSIFNQNISSAAVPIDAMFASNHTMNLNAISSLGNVNTVPIAIGNRSFTQFLAYMLVTLNNNMAADYQQTWRSAYTGYYANQSLVSFADPDSTVTFTPSSATDGIYKYLNAINTPLARLGYVLASDSRIEAQEAAAANEQAVVENFIDSSGDGAVTTSSFSDVSGLSSGVTSNFSTDASPAQIWDIFNSDHGSWFSQETANQLDTTTRTRGSEFETPLLDQQMEEIYKSLGGEK